MVHSGLMIESLEVLRCDSGLLTSFPYGKWIQKINKAVTLKAAGTQVGACVGCVGRGGGVWGGSHSRRQGLRWRHVCVWVGGRNW